MPTRIAPLLGVTLLLAACNRAPDYSTCRLVGIWDFNEATKPVAAIEFVGVEYPCEPTGMVMVFKADGTLECKSTHSSVLIASAQWRPILDEGGRVTIELFVPEHPQARSTRVFVFDDLMHARPEPRPEQDYRLVRATAWR